MPENDINKRTKVMLLWLFTFFFATSSFATDLVGYSHNGNQLVLTRSDNVVVTVNALGHASIEVVYNKLNQTDLPGLAIADSVKETMGSVVTSIEENETSLQFRAENVAVEVQKSPFKLSFFNQGELKVAEASGGFFFDTVRGVGFELQESEKLYGGGQRVMGMDRRGKRMPLYNRASYGYTTEAEQMYYSLPAVMSSLNYAILFDNTASGNLDIGHTQSNVLQFDAVGGRLAYIVTVADALPELVKHVVSITGKQPLPPRWALGNFASRFGYRSEQETRDVVALYNKYDIPLDAIVLDLYWFGPDIKGHMGNLDWDRNSFPTPEKMMAEFANEDVQTVVITEPFILSSSSQFKSAVDNQALALNAQDKPRLFDFYFGNTGLVDVFNDNAQNWFWQYYERLAQQGVNGWWGDLGEPEVHPYDALHRWGDKTVTADEIHNAYGHMWAKMVYERTLAMSPDKRPLVLMRSGYLGSQRYGMIPWTGDVDRSWGGLQPQVELSLQMSLFGLAYTHSDLGGFAGGETFDSELYIRWLQAGTFTPVYRPHAQEHIPPEPVFHDKRTRDIVTSYIQLRYDMLPYNYSLAYENSLTGMPLMRPLSFINATKFFEHDTSYMWGDALLVQPVTQAGVKSVDVQLPAGVWYSFFGNNRFNGGTSINYPLDLEKLPVFVKAGAFVPMQPGIKRTAHASSESLVMNYWADNSVIASKYTLYEDDGDNPNAITDKAYLALDFESAQSEKGLVLRVSPQGQYQGMADSREITWIIHGLEHKISSVVVLDDNAPSSKVDTEITWQWETKNQRLLIKSLISHKAQKELLITFEHGQHSPNAK